MPSASVPVPATEVLFVGKVIVWSTPAKATGGILGAGFTVTCKVSLALAPLLSVTFSSNKYLPLIKLVTVVEAELGLVIVALEGPAIWAQA